MINSERILVALDRHLDHALPLVIYGRAAIALGFSRAPDEVSHSLDVDVIIPLSQTPHLSNDQNFWAAQEAANQELSKDRLYITHLFPADQIFLRRDWEQHLIPVSRPRTQWLKLVRPATLDLILTKMMRGDDPQDLQDIAFMIAHDRITSVDLEQTFAEAVIPAIPELREMFERAKPLVRELVCQAGFSK
jgi:hypothetical protein